MMEYVAAKRRILLSYLRGKLIVDGIRSFDFMIIEARMVRPSLVPLIVFSGNRDRFGNTIRFFQGGQDAGERYSPFYQFTIRIIMYYGI